MSLTQYSNCVKHNGCVSVSVTRVKWTYEGGVNSTSGQSWEEPSSSTISAEASFNGDSKEGALNGSKTCWQ